MCFACIVPIAASERRRATRVARALALNPIAAAVVWMAVLLAIVSTRPLVSSDEAVLGKSAASIANLIAVRYAREIHRIGVDLALVALGFGVLLGAAATVLLVLRCLIRRQTPDVIGLRATAAGLALVVSLHAACCVSWMIRYPQLYSPALWQHGGARASLERLVTGTLRPFDVPIATACGILLVLLGSPRQWPARVSAIAAASRRRLGVVASVAGAAGAAVLLVQVLTTIGQSRGRTAPVVASLPTASGTTRPTGPNVVILASDGLRADRLTSDVTPNLDALAARGTRFERAYTSMPRTFGSWMTLLTGLYPHHHGVRSDFPRWDAVSAPFDGVPQRLARSGYATAVVSDYAGDVFARVDLGFETIRVPASGFVDLLRRKGIERILPLVPALQSHLGRRIVPALWGMSVAADPELVADDAIRTLRSIEDRPFFLVVFFSTTHFPYAAPYPDYARFADPKYDGPYRYEKTLDIGSALNEPPSDVRQIRALYDGAAHAVDAAAGRILSALANDGLSDRTIVVVASDHGENLYEHGHGQGHGDHLFGDQGTHVPLVIYDPRAHAPHTEHAVVQSVDLAPTLYDLAGVAPPERMDGRSLAAAVRGAPLGSEFAYAETELWLVDQLPVPRPLRFPTPGLLDLLEVDEQHGDELVTKAAVEPLTLFARHRMVRDGRWKLVYAPTPLGVRYVLLDTRDDPEELADASARAPGELGRMKQALWNWMLGDPSMHKEGDFLVPNGMDLAQLLNGARAGGGGK